MLFFFKQKTAYEMRISDWSSDVCSSDLTEGIVEGGIRFYTDRFRTAYGAAGTTSTRLSSKSSDFWDGTNAQNIRGTFRDFLVADPECILLDVDFSQSD